MNFHTSRIFADTPNAVAYAMAKTGATTATSRDCKFARGKEEGFEKTDSKGFLMLTPSRIKNAGWMKSDKDAHFMTA